MVAPEDVGDVQFIIDTGSDFDVFNKKRSAPLKGFVRKMANVVTFDTAGGERDASDGLRLQVGWWDRPSDYLLLKDSPNLQSAGSRTRAGLCSLVMACGKQYACYVDTSRQKVVVFPFRGNIPMYSENWVSAG